MKILVTGGSGLVGTSLKKFLPNAVYVSSKDYNLYESTEVSAMYQDIQPTHVIHLAGKVGGVVDNMAHPVEFFVVNILMNTLMIKEAYRFGVSRFVGTLSSCCYPGTVDSYPMKEEVLFDGPPPKTNNTYGVSKRAMATQIEAYNQQFGTKYSYVIPCNIYGEHGSNEGNNGHFIASLMEKIYTAEKQGEDIVLMGDGKPLRQHLYVDDFAKILKGVIDRDITDSFNIAPQENLSIKEIADIAVKDMDVSIKFDPSMPSGQYRKDADTTLFRSIFPDFEFTPLSIGLKKCYEYYKTNKTS